MLHYIASKGAILSMTRSLATEFGDDNVLVNAVSPGLTITESVAEAGHVTGYFQEAVMAARILKRPAVAEDVATVIFFFASNDRSEEHTSELQSLMRISYAVFCLKKKKNTN